MFSPWILFDVGLLNPTSNKIQGENISPAEFHKILPEMEKYRKIPKNIQRLNKTKVKEITKIKKKTHFIKEEKNAKKVFYKKMVSISDILGISFI